MKKLDTGILVISGPILAIVIIVLHICSRIFGFHTTLETVIEFILCLIGCMIYVLLAWKIIKNRISEESNGQMIFKAKIEFNWPMKK